MNESFTFDDVLLKPGYSAVRPHQVNLRHSLSRRVPLNLPIVSAPMDTVTEHKMAIAMAAAGGLGIIHKNLPPEIQAEEVTRVKRWENGFIEDPVTLRPEQHISDAVAIEQEYGYNKIPIVSTANKLVGLLTDLDYFFPNDLGLPIKLKMKPLKELTVATKGISLQQANTIIRTKKLSVLPVVDRKGTLVALVTRTDLLKNEAFPFANKDEKKQLLVGAAVSVGDQALERAKALVAAGVDVLVIDVAHGHSAGVIETLRRMKKSSFFKGVDIIAGNVATAEGTKALIDAGADAVKVGVGPGAICTTRVVAGIGVPQLTAIMEAATARLKTRKNVPIIADGGLKYSGDIVKALAAGADSVMTGSLLAGTDEAPGEIIHDQGRTYKSYRGMGSVGAMVKGSADRYAQAEADTDSLIAEGVEGRVPYRGPVHRQLLQLAGGVRAGFAYLGAKTITDAHRKAQFVRITNAGLTESHPFGVEITRRPANY